MHTQMLTRAELDSHSLHKFRLHSHPRPHEVAVGVHRGAVSVQICGGVVHWGVIVLPGNSLHSLHERAHDVWLHRRHVLVLGDGGVEVEETGRGVAGRSGEFRRRFVDGVGYIGGEPPEPAGE